MAGILVVVTERVADVRHDVDASRAAACFTLEPLDAGSGCGYARVVVCAPTGRVDGVAILLGDDATAPDPVQLRVREGKAAKLTGHQPTLELRRKALPVLVRVDRDVGTAVVVRRILPPVSES